MLDHIVKDAEQTPTEKFIVVTLGDLIDRGPDSKAVVDLILAFPTDRISLFHLMGNHEEMLMHALGDRPTLVSKWLKMGGYPTAHSYGLTRDQLNDDDDPEIICARLKAAIPQRHLEFLSSGLDSLRFGDFFLAHAGIRPGVPLEQQSPTHLRWIRDDFLTSNRDHGVTVVHGHSVTEKAEVLTNRIGLDTGACASGHLTAARLSQNGIDIIAQSLGA